MAVVLFLVALLAGGVQVVAADGDNVVAAVGRRVPDGLVLAHEGDCDLRGDAAQRARVGADVDEVPCAAVGEVCLRSCLVQPLDLLASLALRGWCTFPTYCDIVG